MKQKGNEWITADGKTTLLKYLPKHDVLFEKLGQKIAAEAIALEMQIRETKETILKLCKEAFFTGHKLRGKKFTFYTFDHEYKIEYFYHEPQSFRIFRATQKNPGHKEYEAIRLAIDATATEKILDQINAQIEKEEVNNQQSLNL